MKVKTGRHACVIHVTCCALLLLLFGFITSCDNPAAPDTTPPAEVTNLVATAGNALITLSWTEPGDADYAGVRVYSGDSLLSDVAKGTTTGTVTGLTNGTSYALTVKTYDTTGNESAGASASATPIAPDTTPPAEVTNLTATAGSGSITLSWTEPVDTDFANVKIYSETVLVDTVLKGTTEKTISSLTNGTTYTYTVKTCDSTGNESTGTSASATPVVEIPQTATNLAISSTADNTLSVSFTGVVKSGATYKLMGFKDGSSTGTVLRTWTADATSYTATITGVAAGNWTFQVQDASGNILITFTNAVSVANQQVASNLSVSSSSYNTLSVSFTGEFKSGATYKLVGFKDGSTTGTVLKTWSADGASYSATIASVAAGSWTFQIQDANGNVLTSLTTAVTVSNQPSYSLTTDGYTYNAAAKTLSINNSNYAVEISGNSSITAGSTINLSSLGLTASAYQEVTLIVKSGSTVLDTKTIPLMDKFASTSANEGPWSAAMKTFSTAVFALNNASSAAHTVAVGNLAQDTGNHTNLDGNGTTIDSDTIISNYATGKGITVTTSNWDSVVGQYFADAAVQPETYSPTKTWTESLKGTDGFAVVIDNLSTILTYFETNTTYASLFKTSLLQMIFNNSDLLTAAQKTTAMQALYPAMTGATIN